ncbi:MAG TPA: hypothetical protein VFI74_01415 [Candidatus Saccharimonadales bacterium]|nr:hypothetical protein [Candidatus Saccharimonadales bacterium]
MKRIMSALALAVLIGSTVVALHRVDRPDTPANTEATTASSTHHHKQ